MGAQPNQKNIHRHGRWMETGLTDSGEVLIWHSRVTKAAPPSSWIILVDGEMDEELQRVRVQIGHVFTFQSKKREI